MSPPELIELSSPMYALTLRFASEECVNTRKLPGLHFLYLSFSLDEKSFPKLITANERFHRAESDEQVLYFAILVDLLRRT
jgi:hypothetical protein